MRNVLNTFSRPLLGSNSVALDATTVGRFAPPCFDSLSPSAMELTTNLVALRTARTHSNNPRRLHSDHAFSLDPLPQPSPRHVNKKPVSPSGPQVRMVVRENTTKPSLLPVFEVEKHRWQEARYYKTGRVVQ